MADLGCSLNAAIAFDFFVGKGLKDFQAAAIVGNLEQESRLDPRVPAGDGGRALGIAQWHPPRWRELLIRAAKSNRDPWALDTQLEFIWHELETNPAAGLSELRSSATLEQAVVAFQDLFERCGVCATHSRILFAKSALYSCPRVRPPTRRFGFGAAAMGLVALVAAAGFGASKALRAIR